MMLSNIFLFYDLNLFSSVADDKLSNITHVQAPDNQCNVSWNDSIIPDYITGYLVKVLVEGRGACLKFC